MKYHSNHSIEDIAPNLRIISNRNYIILNHVLDNCSGLQTARFWAQQVLDQSINTADATGQFETEIRAERQMEGIQKAKQRGVAFGRQKKLSDQEIKQLKEKRGQGVLIKDLMKEYGLSKASVYRYLENSVQP